MTIDFDQYKSIYGKYVLFYLITILILGLANFKINVWKH